MSKKQAEIQRLETLLTLGQECYYLGPDPDRCPIDRAPENLGALLGSLEREFPDGQDDPGSVAYWCDMIRDFLESGDGEKAAHAAVYLGMTVATVRWGQQLGQAINLAVNKFKSDQANAEYTRRRDDAVIACYSQVADELPDASEAVIRREVSRRLERDGWKGVSPPSIKRILLAQGSTLRQSG